MYNQFLDRDIEVIKMSISSMYHLFSQSRTSQMPIMYVAITYDFPMKDRSRAEKDIEQFWERFSDSIPYIVHNCSIDQKKDGSWYFNLLMCSVLPDEEINFNKLYSCWDFGKCFGITIPEEALDQFFNPFDTIQSLLAKDSKSIPLVQVGQKDHLLT